MIRIDFDDIIYSLQKFGGASVYWNNITSRVDQDPRFVTRHLKPKKSLRFIPVLSEADLFHSSHFRTCLSRRTKIISTVHDLTYELGHVGSGLRAKVNIYERKQSYFQSDGLICISSCTKRDLLNVYPQLSNRIPIYVIHHGFNLPIQKKIESSRPRHKPGPYILFVGARRGYKNFKGALIGFWESRLWKQGYKLVCTGCRFDEDELAEIKKMGLSEHVISIGKITANDLYQLYVEAYCLVYSSTYEGFGLPVLEAMSLGCPVTASNISSIPEVAGGSAILFNPENIHEISKALVQVGDSLFRDRLIKLGFERVKNFSWEKSAEAHMRVYEETAKLPKLH